MEQAVWSDRKMIGNVETQASQDGVDVIEVASLDAEHAAKFKKPWLIQFSDGGILEFNDEGSACKYQREHRAKIGLDEMMGLPVTSSNRSRPRP